MLRFIEADVWPDENCYNIDYHYGSLAQLVEQRLEEPCVPSSSLGGATKFAGLAQLFRVRLVR